MLEGHKDKANAQILAVSIDSHADSLKMIHKLREKSAVSLDFPLLEDRDHKVIDHYGIRNPEGKEWPHSATYVIDKQGIVQRKFVEIDVAKRPSNEQILTALRKLR